MKTWTLPRLSGSGMIAAKSVLRFSGGYVEITSSFLLRLFSYALCTLFYIAAFYIYSCKESIRKDVVDSADSCGMR
jgi:hypothetical protein